MGMYVHQKQSVVRTHLSEAIAVTVPISWDVKYSLFAPQFLTSWVLKLAVLTTFHRTHALEYCGQAAVEFFSASKEWKHTQTRRTNFGVSVYYS